MRLRIDNALSPTVAALLRAGGHDAVHLRDVADPSLPDDAVFDLAADTGRTIVSADTDFGTLLALPQAGRPSVVLVRRLEGRRPSEQAAMLLANLPELAEALADGAVAVIEEDRVRVRPLPIRPTRADGGLGRRRRGRGGRGGGRGGGGVARISRPRATARP